MKGLDKLSKEQLKTALEHVLTAHEKHYESVNNDEENVYSGFYQLSGNIIAVREQFNLPPLPKK
jgi:hypothetical protein